MFLSLFPLCVVWCGVVWCVCVCVCVRGVEEWGGVVPKHPCFLTHLNNELDIAMSYLYREVPALLFYFGGSAKLRFRYISIYICRHYLFLYV